ncbi:unnamed protein product [Notodromas monacha]|uniref:PhoH-like protein domain-containing protein n=1 Tax=Notodromas monacha TaxID=399045 RepID=A0A7R9C1R0_9CRUS|nr:unnamed protein product [Notodromas monacha]CAG0925818.1 unnamed protein product [Notodromas monacha]
MDLTQQFDGVVLTSETLQVGPQEIQQAIDQLDEDLKKAIQLAYANIKAFHEAQKRETLVLETMPGVLCERRAVPIQKVGLYIPGGSAPLFSTVLMLAVPAQIAGCEQMVLCTPPNAQGQIHPAILFTAHLCGITKIYKLGGAQAIAAMTLGTAIVPKVYKLFGPGNQYVTAAKQYAQNYGVAIDMPAGPSEVLVVADHTASPAFVASDLLSQAEHGSDSQVVLLCTHPELIPQVEVALDQQLNELPRKEIAQKALNHARLVQVADLDQALEISNAYAPEHLILSVEHPRACIDKKLLSIQNTGSVLLYGVLGKAIKAQSANQQKIVESAQTHDMIFAVGPAGTGKTYTAVALAVKALK